MVGPEDFYRLGNSTRPSAPVAHARPELAPSDLGGNPVLVFDTETAGLGRPGICQLAYMLVEKGTVVEYSKVLKLPPTVRMSPDAVKIHMITAQASAAGADPGPELLAFWSLVNRVQGEGGTVVGHNVAFDANAFNFSCRALGLTNEVDARHMTCTMQRSKQHSHLTNARGHAKHFKLSELYERLFGTPPAWARLHNALDDVAVGRARARSLATPDCAPCSQVTALCFREGMRLGWW
jgi:DNA polymerase III epsilon subunit-like protein